MSADVKASIKQQEIKDLVVILQNPLSMTKVICGQSLT